MADNLTKTRDRMGMLNLIIAGKDYSKYIVNQDIFKSTESKLESVGKKVYSVPMSAADTRGAIFHLDNSTILLKYLEKTNQTELHIYGNTKKTIKKLEGVLQDVR